MKIIYILFLCFIFFPYIKMINIPTDTQPNAFVFSIILSFLLYIKFKIKPLKSIVHLFILIFLSLIFVTLDSFSFNSLRNAFGYVSLPFITYATYAGCILLCKDGEFLNVKIVKIAIIVWGTVGAIQNFFNRNFLTGILSRSVTSENRGVVSLAVEPTFYGTMMIFFIVYVCLFFVDKKEKIIYVFLCLVQIFLFSKSGMIFLILVLGLLIYFLIKIFTLKNYKALVILVLSFIMISISIFIFLKLNSDFRIARIFESILKNPVGFFKNDESANRATLITV